MPLREWSESRNKREPSRDLMASVGVLKENRPSYTILLKPVPEKEKRKEKTWPRVYLWLRRDQIESQTLHHM